MFPVTSIAYHARPVSAYPAPSAPDSSEFAKGLFDNFKQQLNSLPGRECSEYIRNILTYVSTEFPDDMSEFQKALNERTLTLAENSSETRAVSINPMGKLLDKYECFELPDHLNSLVIGFNSRLTDFSKCLELSKSSPATRDYYLPDRTNSLGNFGKFIFCMHSRECDVDNWSVCYDDPVNRANEAKNNLEAWHKSIKLLCEGILDPLLVDPFSSNYNAKSKEEAIKLLYQFEELLQTCEKNNYCRFRRLINLLDKGFYRQDAQSYFSELILKDFINSGNVLVFQKTLKLLFSYYQFTPDAPFDEISTDLNDKIKSLLKK
ncbi:hypothetical protein [Endozoicomonas sp. SESOKO1]|uniref:hypothetical protein n=1 Tax=Endozoicomonas sp. SESOKO1 TaxID=2828742 RepID=UPI002148043B|nr:hypothetical protein [Endozoicomonas sp. SESOKO1]